MVMVQEEAVGVTAPGRVPRSRIWSLGPPLAVLCLVGIWGSSLSGYWLHVVDNALIYVILAISLNIALGLGGLVSFGHSAFFAVGAYAVGLATTKLDWSFWLSLLVGLAAAATLGLICGLASLRVGMHYLALITLGASVSVQVILGTWTSVTNGTDGVAGVPPITIGGTPFTTDRMYLWLLLGAAAVAVALFAMVDLSRFGRRLRLLAVGETLAELLGVRTATLKIAAFALSGAIAGLAGALYAPWLGYVDPSLSGIDVTIAVLVMLAVGGAGSGTGAVLGALVISLVQEWLKFLGDFQNLSYLLFAALILLLVPRGLTTTGVDLRRLAARRWTGRSRDE